jgi:biotin carboxyl carrier protein
VRYRISVERQTFEIEIKRDGQVWIDDHPIEVDLEDLHDPDLYSLLVDHRSFEARVELIGGEERQVFIAGRPYRACLLGMPPSSTDNTARVRTRGPAEITTPLPGWLSEIRVSDGQLVKVGDVIAVMESMKMFLELRTAHAGLVHLMDSKVCREVAKGEIIAIINHVYTPDRLWCINHLDLKPYEVPFVSTLNSCNHVAFWHP